jgi:hypothetical protein
MIEFFFPLHRPSRISRRHRDQIGRALAHLSFDVGPELFRVHAQPIGLPVLAEGVEIRERLAGRICH